MTTLSIFTCVIGEPLALIATAESIRPWLSKNLNWIIKFSAQTNVDFINRFSGDYINSYQTVDHSLYDGLNQCLQICESDYYMVLGAGDTLLPDGMTAISKELLQHTPTYSSYNAPLFLEAEGNSFYPNPSHLRYRMSCPHPTSILKVLNSRQIDGFDTSYKIASDYDHLSRYTIAYGEGAILNIPPPVSYMGGGMSDVRALESYIETLLIRQRVWGASDVRIFGDMLKFSSTAISDSITQNNS